MSSLKHFTDENFAAETAQGVVLVDFYADWCGPCRMMTPVIEEFANDHQGKIAVGKIDIDASPNVTQMYGVTSIPTLILFKDGEPVGTFVGLKDKNSLTNLVQSALK